MSESIAHRESADLRQGADLTAAWARVRGRLRNELGEATYRSWLKPLVLIAIRNETVRMAVPTRFMRDWVTANYADRIRGLWISEARGVKEVEIVVKVDDRPAVHPPHGQMAGARSAPVGAERDEEPQPPIDAGGTAQPAASAGSGDGSKGARRKVSDAGLYAAPDMEARAATKASLDARFTFENFVVGKTNELAYAASRRVAEANVVPFNPLFLYGGVGLGKTHLMHAIAWHLRETRPERRVIYLSAETFMYQFVRALRLKDTMAFKDQFRSVDVLMIDDVQFISGREATQEEFFHTFNALVDQNRQVVISADKSPSDLEGMEERLRSRLGWGLVADIHPTTYELRLGILQANAERLGADIPEKVLEFLAHKITSNVRELEGALTRIAADATLVGRTVTLETTQELLHDLLRANDRRVTIEEIQKRVAEHFNIKVSEMYSARRARAVARPRQVAMYLAKQLTSRSLPEIGRKFGGRDHTTVMHAVRKIEELRAIDSSFAEDVELLRRMLGG